MGFFSSSSKQETYNAPLDQYTTNYRSWAPWSFSQTDPEAYLAAYASGKRGEGYDAATVGRATEQVEAEKLDKQAADQALARFTERQKSGGQYLNPEDQALITDQINKAYAYQYGEAENQFKRAADYTAGGRGLRMSDTPVSDPMGRAYKETLLGLGSARAQSFLTSGLEIAGQRQNERTQQNQFDLGFVEFQRNMEFNRWSSRMNYLYGGGLQGAAGIRSKTEGSATPSGFQQMTAAFGFAKDVAGTAGSFASGYGGGGGMTGGFKALS